MPSRQVFCKGGLQIQVIQDDKALQARRGPRRGPWSERRRERCPACDEGLQGVGRDADFLGPKPIPDPNSKLGLLKRRNSGEKELTPTVRRAAGGVPHAIQLQGRQECYE